MQRDRVGVVWAGLSLIGLGVAFLVASWVGWDKAWPIFPLFGGLTFLVGYFVGGRRDEGFVFLGTAAFLLGLFFFGFTLGYWEWGEMSVLWPVFPLIGGVALVALFLADRKHDAGLLAIGLVALVVGGAGLAYTHGRIGTDIVQYWPILLVLAGVVGLIGALFRGGRRE